MSRRPQQDPEEMKALTSCLPTYEAYLREMDKLLNAIRPEGIMNAQPSAEAVALAIKLSGHQVCDKPIAYQMWGENWEVCDSCIAAARTIDRELQLPERNAALLLAQGVADAFKKNDLRIRQLEELVEALAAIKTA